MNSDHERDIITTPTESLPVEPVRPASASSTADEAGNDQNVSPAEPTRKTSGEATRETGGRPGPDPVRYGDWEKNGRCIDF